MVSAWGSTLRTPCASRPPRLASIDSGPTNGRHTKGYSYGASQTLCGSSDSYT